MRPLAVVGLLVSFAGILAMPAFAQAAEQDVSQGALLFFRSPAVTEPALGNVEVEVEVVGDGQAQVIFLVDGEEKGRVENPPFRVTVDLGDQFGPHTFEVVVLDSRGAELARATRETPGLMVDDRVQLDLRQLYVTVTPPNGAKVDLGRDEFEVRDEGVEQDLVTFEGGDAALTVALLLDASESMRGGRLEAALAGRTCLFRDERTRRGVGNPLLRPDRVPDAGDPAVIGTCEPARLGRGARWNRSQRRTVRRAGTARTTAGSSGRRLVV